MPDMNPVQMQPPRPNLLLGSQPALAGRPQPPQGAGPAQPMGGRPQLGGGPPPIIGQLMMEIRKRDMVIQQLSQQLQALKSVDMARPGGGPPPQGPPPPMGPPQGPPAPLQGAIPPH